MENFKKTRTRSMNVELVLATRMLKRASIIYILCPLLFLIRSQNAFVTSLASSIIVAVGFYLGAVIMSYAAKISLNFYYFAAIFGYLFRLIFIFGLLLLPVSYTHLTLPTN